MRKRIASYIAFVLAAVLLCGCAVKSPGDILSGGLGSGGLSGLFGQAMDALSDSFAADEHNPDGVHFSEMRYVRPDTEKLAADVAAVEEALDAGKDLKTVEELLDVCMDDYYNFSTMVSLVNIYNCKDLRDEYYAAEYEWCSTEDATVSQLFDEMYYACAGSSLGAELEEDYFWEGFCEDYADPEDSYYNDTTVALMQRESELIARYRELVAEPTVVFHGEEVDFYEKLEELSDYSDYTGYISYLNLLLTYYRTYSEPLADVYIELMRTRTEMAEAMGFSSCEEMEFVFYFDRDYTPADAAAFIAQVKEKLVPIYVWADDRGLGYDVNYSEMDSTALFDSMHGVADSLGGPCIDAFSFMNRYGLYDIEPSLYKADTSFETYLDNYEAPFIFINPDGDSRDLLTFVHEFGHYTDAYVNYDASESIDLAEVYSQALEFLSLSHMDGILSESEVEAMRKAKVLDALDTFIQQAAFAEFESKAHALGPDALNADVLCEIALQTTKDFGFCPEGFEEYMMYYWMDITHLFEYPFYVISYPVSLNVAMQIYELEAREPGKGLEKYFEMLPRDYDTFMDTVSGNGLNSPFEASSVDAIARVIADTIGYPKALDAAA